MHIHVFTIDILPGDKIVSSGGSLRSQQIIAGLRGAGAEVTYSIPRSSDGVKAHWELLTAEERENAFSLEPSAIDPGRSHLDIVNRIKPDAVVYLWPAAFSYPRSTKADVVTVMDMNGFQNVEGALARSAITGAGFSIADLTREYLNKIACGDVLISGSEAQRAYWSGLHGLLSDTYQSLDMIDVPYCPPLPIAAEYALGGPTFFSAGSFLPWNSPESHLEIVASLIEKAGRGHLVIVGRANPMLPHAGKVNARLRRLKERPGVEVIPGMPYGAFSAMINATGIGIDLNARTFEREFAVPIRTVTFLAHGVPMITNDYSVLANEIGRFGAGWTVDTQDATGFKAVVESILEQDDDEGVAHRSARARTMVAERFDTTKAFATLLGRIEDKRAVASRKAAMPAPSMIERARSGLAGNRLAAGQASRAPVVLIVTDDMENFLALRIKIPFDAMYRAGRIAGYVVFRKGKVILSVGSPDRLGTIDVVWVQRGPTTAVDMVLELFDGRYAYDIDDNLLVSPTYRQPFSQEWRDVIITMLASAACVATTTPRLVDSLQRHARVQFEQKVFMSPNVTDIVTPRRFTGTPAALVLATSDSLPLTTSRAAFFAAINKFCAGRDMPLLYMGPHSAALPEVTAQVITTGVLDYESYRGFLRNENIMAIAPLEQKADFLTSEFINCKSDIKMVEFGAAGVPAVFSAAAPYADSPLATGPLVDCGDQQAVLDALEAVCDDADRVARQAGERVTALRLADQVAVNLWMKPIEAARLPVPVQLSTVIDTYNALNPIGRDVVVVPEAWFDADDYLAMHPDVADLVLAGSTTAYEHYATTGARRRNAWFPGTLSSEAVPATIARYRKFVLTEPAKLEFVEQRIATSS